MTTESEKALDQEQRESLADENFRALADDAPVLLWVTDEKHQCAFLSRAWLEFTGQTEAAGLGMGWTEPVHPDDRERVSRIFLAAAERREPFSLDYRLRRADGVYRWSIDSGRPRFAADGSFLGYVGSVIDVHERKLAEEQLRRQSALIEGVSRGTQDLIAVQDADYRYVYFNDAYRRTFESLWGKALRAGTSMLEALADWPGELEKARQLWARAHRGETFSITMAFGPQGGRQRMFDLRFNPVRDASGHQIGAAHILRDVTAQKDIEAKLRRADQQKDVFLATLAHELRNPLAPILTAAQLLASPKLESAQLGWAQGVIERQARNMALLLDDLLDVSRITRGKLTLKRQRVSLAAIVDASIETARPLIDRHEHRLKVALPTEMVVLDADPLRLSQILSNLLTNAAKYTDPGGRIEIIGRVRDGSVEIEVSDNGIGIAPETLADVFEPFAQVDGSRTRAEGGLGIGLALVRGLVELHGGRIDAESQGEGRGSTFRVSLPHLDGARDSARTADTDPTRPPQGRRVVLADDNRDGADALAMLLRVGGHDIRVAYDGESALALAEAHRPEVAILDIGLPDMSGYRVAQQLRAAAWASDLVLIALTGWGQDEDRARAAEAGFDHHLTKPVDIDRVVALLRRMEPRGTG